MVNCLGGASGWRNVDAEEGYRCWAEVERADVDDHALRLHVRLF